MAHFQLHDNISDSQKKADIIKLVFLVIILAVSLFFGYFTLIL